MVPWARLELARIAPHAPQTCASTNSATRAPGTRGKGILAENYLPKLFRGRCRSRRNGCRSRSRSRNGGLCGHARLRPRENRRPRPCLDERDRDGEDGEGHEGPRRDPFEKRSGPAGAEGRLGGRSAECGRNVRALSLLQKDDEDEEDADDDVNWNEYVDHVRWYSGPSGEGPRAGDDNGIERQARAAREAGAAAAARRRATKSFAAREALPTRPPSTSASSKRPGALAGDTEPP